MVGSAQVFVGRAPQLAQFGLWLQPRHAGGLMLVAGEAGVGKSRVVAEALAGSGRRVIWSTCWEGDGEPAFSPWIL